MILLLIGLSYAHSTTDISRLLAMTSQLNISLQHKQIISAPFARAPLFNPLFSDAAKILTISSTHFSKLGSSLIQGQPISLHVTKCKFSNSVSPVRLNGELDPEIQKQLEEQTKQQNKQLNPIETNSYRRSIKDGDVHFDQTMFEFCRSQVDGGCLLLTNCICSISFCFFFESSAKNGGAVYVAGGERARLSDSNFVKCFSRERGGGAYIEDTNLELKRSNFVRNRAGNEGGASYITRCFLDSNSNKIYNNQATKHHAGLVFIECLGRFIQNHFLQNSAIEEMKGYSLYVEGNPDVLCIEINFFYDMDDFPVAISTDANVFLTNDHFMMGEDKAFYIKAIAGELPLMKLVNCRYYGNKMKEAPTLPSELMREEFTYEAYEEPFAWRSIYLVGGIFAVILAIMAIFLPLLVQPTFADKGWSKQQEELKTGLSDVQ